ncbi:MAG: hypothetical protein JXA14_21450 [Anaerolineae bacterium]|nr:hypothetical protein [Anaerolineae bacterium]
MEREELWIQELLTRIDELLASQFEDAPLWSLYYVYGGPELEPNALWRKIAEAQRLEPGNERLMEVVALIKAQRGQK